MAVCQLAALKGRAKLYWRKNQNQDEGTKGEKTQEQKSKDKQQALVLEGYRGDSCWKNVCILEELGELEDWKNKGIKNRRGGKKTKQQRPATSAMRQALCIIFFVESFESFGF